MSAAEEADCQKPSQSSDLPSATFRRQHLPAVSKKTTMSFFFRPPPYERIVKIAARLASPFAGERDNAVAALMRLFDAHRLPIPAAAIDYATKRGWTVFPAEWRPSKKGGLKKGLKAARFSNGQRWGSTRDVVEIVTDWLRWPQANLGVVCGPDSGIWVVEIDIKPDEGVDGGAACRWRGWKKSTCKLPDTLMAVTPSGSIHRYFNWPRDGRDIRNSASKLGRGIDVRANGGMVIAPPSMRDGRRYRWINEATIADAPEWLIAAAIAASSGMPRSGGTHTPDPDEAFDADGLRQDGREAFMRGVVWREVRKWYRELGGCLPPKNKWQSRCAKAYEEFYEVATVTRIDGVSKREGLEREGRGPTEFWGKWQYTMSKWGSPEMAAGTWPSAPEYYADDDGISNFSETVGCSRRRSGDGRR